MGIAPLPGSVADERDVEQIGFVGIHQRCLLFGDGGRDERLANGVGVDAVIDLGQGAPGPPLFAGTALNSRVENIG